MSEKEKIDLSSMLPRDRIESMEWQLRGAIAENKRLTAKVERYKRKYHLQIGKTEFEQTEKESAHATIDRIRALDEVRTPWVDGHEELGECLLIPAEKWDRAINGESDG